MLTRNPTNQIAGHPKGRASWSSPHWTNWRLLPRKTLPQVRRRSIGQKILTSYDWDDVTCHQVSAKNSIPHLKSALLTIRRSSTPSRKSAKRQLDRRSSPSTWRVSTDRQRILHFDPLQRHWKNGFRRVLPCRTREENLNFVYNFFFSFLFFVHFELFAGILKCKTLDSLQWLSNSIFLKSDHIPGPLPPGRGRQMTAGRIWSFRAKGGSSDRPCRPKWRLRGIAPAAARRTNVSSRRRTMTRVERWRISTAASTITWRAFTGPMRKCDREVRTAHSVGEIVLLAFGRTPLAR